jgi:signal transduction histidine kinase
MAVHTALAGGNTDEDRKGESLFSNIVFRLNGPDSEIARAREKFCWFSGTILGLVFLLSICSQFISANNIFWIDTSVHSLIESYCGIISFIIAYIIYREYRSSGRRSNLFLFLGFVSMGIFDFFHAYSNHCITLFVWFHTLSAFSGGAYFLWSVLSVKRTAKDPPWLRRLFVCSGVTLNIAAAIALWRLLPPLPQAVTTAALHHVPVDIPIKGEFTASTITVNILAALFFLASGLFFLRYFKATNDVLFHTFSLSAFLFFESELLFALSRLWDPSWWYWHAIKLIIYVGLVIGLSHGLSRTFNELRESRRKLAGALGELQHAYAHLRDTQEELLESEKLASIGKLAATVAHEIRNPLGAINNSIGIFKRHSRLAGDDRELMDIVDREIVRLNKIISDFLNFARPSPLEKRPTDLNRLIEETVALFLVDNGGGTSSVRLNKYLDRELPEVPLDRDALGQCLWNVLINSVQAMQEGGTLTVKTRYFVTRRNGASSEEAAIVISDSGPGIPEATALKAFQPFFSTKARGTGLGLSIVQRIVRQHGGEVSLRSVVGKGTQVEITLPLDHDVSLKREEAGDGVPLNR